jgi:hypothetical protein
MPRIELGAFADRVAVGAMRSGDVVIVAQRHASADDGSFLPDTRVIRAGNLSYLVQARALFLEAADAHHPAIGFSMLDLGQRHQSLSSSWAPMARKSPGNPLAAAYSAQAMGGKKQTGSNSA